MKASRFFVSVVLFAMAITVSAQVKITDLTAKAKLTKLQTKAKRVHSYTVKNVPKELQGLQAVYAPRGDSNKPGVKFSFKVDVPVAVYLLVDARPNKLKLEGWKKTKLKATWIASKKTYKDVVYSKDFPAGVITIPANPKGCIPHMAVVKKK